MPILGAASTTFTQETIWTTGTAYVVGDIVPWQARNWLCTADHTAGANFDTTKFASVGKLDAGPAYYVNMSHYGHSWSGYWPPRLAGALGTSLYYNGGVAGAFMADAAVQIAKLANYTSGIYLLGCTVNDTSSNSAAAQLAFQKGLRSWLCFARALGVAGTASASGRLLPSSGISFFTFTGTWTTTTDTNTAGGSRRTTVTQNDSVLLSFYGDAVDIMLMGPASGSGAAYSVTSPGGAVLATGTLSVPAYYDPVRLSGFGPGFHSVIITKTDANGTMLTLDCALVPHTTVGIPAIVVMKDPPLIDGGHTYKSVYDTLTDGVVAESTYAGLPIQVVDASVGTSWDTSVDLDPTGYHPSDRGTNKIWQRVYTALASLAYRYGLSSLSYADSLTVAPTATSGSDNFTRTANPASLGVTSTGNYPWIVSDHKAVYGTDGTRTVVTTMGANYSSAVIETGKADVTLTWVVGTATNAGVAMRQTVGGTMLMWGLGNLYAITANSPGSALTPTSGAGTSYNAGDTIQAVLSGSSVTLKVNGSTVATYTTTFNQTATKHGITATLGTGAKFSSFTWA